MSMEMEIEAPTCSICHDAMGQGTGQIIVLPCNHMFHENCIKTAVYAAGFDGITDEITQSITFSPPRCPYCKGRFDAGFYWPDYAALDSLPDGGQKEYYDVVDNDGNEDGNEDMSDDLSSDDVETPTIYEGQKFNHDCPACGSSHELEAHSANSFILSMASDERCMKCGDEISDGNVLVCQASSRGIHLACMDD